LCRRLNPKQPKNNLNVQFLTFVLSLIFYLSNFLFLSTHRFSQTLTTRFENYSNQLKTSLKTTTQKLEDFDETITTQCNTDKLEIAKYEQALDALDSAEHTMHHQDKVLKTIPGISSSRRSISSEFSSTEKKMIRGLQKQLKHLKKQYKTQMKKKTKQVKRLRKNVKVLQLQNDSYRKQQELCDVASGGAVSMIGLKHKNKSSKKKKKSNKKRKVNHIFCFKTVYEQRTACSAEGERVGTHSIDRCFGGKHECEKAREEVDTQSCERGTFPVAFQKPVEKGDCVRLKKPVAKPHFEKSLFQ